MAEIEAPPPPMVIKERVSRGSGILDQVKRLLNRSSSQISNENPTRIHEPILPPADDTEYETAVSTMESSVMRICGELKPHFENGRYGMIVGDDTSGRLPALAIKGVADFVSETYGKKKPDLIFLQPSIRVHPADVVKQFNKRVLPKVDELKGKRVLIVSDYIASGKTIRRIINQMNEVGIKFDIAALAVVKVWDSQTRSYTAPFGLKGGLLFDGHEREIYPGDPVPSAPQIWLNNQLSGLSSADYDKPVGVLSGSDNRQDVSAARRDVKRLITRTVRAIYG